MKNIFLVLVGIVVLSACGQKVDPALVPFQGEWKSTACYFNAYENAYSASVYSIAGNQIAIIYGLFTDNACTNRTRDLQRDVRTLSVAQNNKASFTKTSEHLLSVSGDLKTLIDETGPETFIKQ